MSGEYVEWAWSAGSPMVAMWSAAVFSLARRFADRPMREGGVASALASLRFGVYVVHPVFANLLYKALDWRPDLMPPVAFELSTYAAILLGSLILAIVARHLPMVGKLL